MVDIYHNGEMYTPKKEFEKLQAENEALKADLEKINSYRAILDQSLGVIHVYVKRSSKAAALHEIERCIDLLDELEGDNNG